MTSDSMLGYRQLCRILNPFSEQPLNIAALSVDWKNLWRIGDQTHCLPELHQSLARLLLEPDVPAEMLSLLEEISRVNELRCRLLQEQMVEITQALNRSHIHPVWLKGAALLVQPDWQKRCRLMNDLDLWLPDIDQQPTALNILDELGYKVKSGTHEEHWSKSHHYAPRMHKKRLATLEVHRYLVRPNYAMLLPDDEALAAVHWQEWQSQRIGILSLNDRICHSLIQCTVMASPPLSSGFIRLMKVIDLLRLLALSVRQALPEILVQRVRESPYQAEIGSFMTLLERDFSIPNPFDPDASYCALVDRNNFRHSDYTRWLQLSSFKPPENWEQFLKNPKRWPDKILRRMRMLAGQRIV